MNSEMIDNRYLTVRLIGSGGMADVYLGIDTAAKREVAIKILRGDLANDPVSLKRFKREALSITQVSHPNIVEVYDVGADEGRYYIVMEYVRGQTLKQLIAARGALDSNEAVNIMKQLVSAVCVAHESGIIHRDIKSQNVLIKDDGTVKLSDFGIAIASNDTAQLTQADTVMGSVHYMAPELARGKTASVQSDIYSLGIVFYEMLTGDVPYHADTAVQVALKHMHDPMPAVRDFNATLPQSVENIIIKATAKNPANRYQTAKQMYDDLVTCLDFSRAHETKTVFADPREHPQPVRAAASSGQPVRAKSKSSYNMLLIGSVVVLSLFALVFIVLLNGGFSSQGGDTIKVPDVTYYELEDAKTVLSNMNIIVDNIQREATDDIEAGKVIRTSPAAGSSVKSGDHITVYVSSGTNFTVGSYFGQKLDIVKPQLEAAGFTVVTTTVSDSTAAAGTILTQNIEAGTVIAPTDVRIISFDVAVEQSFTIPKSILGKNIDEAKTLLEGMGGKVTVQQLEVPTKQVEKVDENGETYLDTVEEDVTKGVVIDCDPSVGTYYSQTETSVITLYYY